jgi:hypothetical protein
MNRDCSGWLDAVLVGAQDAQWCTRAYCTTCGGLEFRRAYWAAAAQQAGFLRIASRLEAARYPQDILMGVSDADREVLVRTLIDGLRELPPRLWSNSEAFRKIIIDLDPPLNRTGVPLALDVELSGTPAGDTLARMREHTAGVRELREGRMTYESPQAAEQRKRIKREKKALAHARRLSESRRRNSERFQLLSALARLSPSERLSRFATDSAINLDSVSTELIPTQVRDLIDLESAKAVVLLKRIGQRKGSWGRLRRMLEHFVRGESDSSRS